MDGFLLLYYYCFTFLWDILIAGKHMASLATAEVCDSNAAILASGTCVFCNQSSISMVMLIILWSHCHCKGV